MAQYRRVGLFALQPALRFVEFAQQIADLSFQLREIVLDGFPDDVEVYLEVSVRQSVSHFVSYAPRHIGVLGGEGRVMSLDVPRSFTDDFKLRVTASCVRMSSRKPASSLSSV